MDEILGDRQTKTNFSKEYTFEDFKAIMATPIKGFKIKELTWEHFQASPEADSQWKAHTNWSVGYTYEINMRKLKKSNNIRYFLTIQSWCTLGDRCWVRVPIPRLLEHETGHYLIGCLCALDFKKRAQRQKYSKNFRAEA